MERPRVHNGATNDDGTELDVRCAHFTLMLAVQPHTLNEYGSYASSDPTATPNQSHQLRFSADKMTPQARATDGRIYIGNWRKRVAHGP